MTLKIFTYLSDYIKRNSVVISAVSLIALFYTIIIYMLPDFMTDDYYIFHLIQSNPGSIIVADPNEKFYLFFRPVAYFVFWLFYTLFGLTPILMKFSLLALLCVSLAMVQTTLTNITNFLGVSFPPMISALLLISIGMHPETVQSVLWISNGNELIMVFFYLVAVHLISTIIANKTEPGNGILAVTVLSYLLSILTKQQSLHLPLVLIFILWIYRKSLSVGIKKYLRTTSVIMLIVMLIVLAVNAEQYISRDVTGLLFSSWWKKPFSMAGTFIYLFIPQYGWELYGWFMKNVIVVILISGISILQIIKYYRKNFVDMRKWLYICAMCVIFFFPRLGLPAQDRINVILVFSILPLVFVVVSDTISISKYVFIPLSILIMYSGYEMYNSLQTGVEYFNKKNTELIKYRIENDVKEITISFTHPLFPTQHSIFYFKNHRFGIDSSVNLSGIGIRNMFHWAAIPKSLSVRRNNDTLIYRTDNNDEYLVVEESDRTKYTIIDSANGHRGYTYLKVRLKEVYNIPSLYLTYTDTGWVSIGK